VLTIDWASNPVFSSPNEGSINLTVKFVEFANPLPFTAIPGDPEPYGQMLYYNAMRGDYGPIGPYVPPPSPAPVDSQPPSSGLQTL
jgi:hypothetical protein